MFLDEQDEDVFREQVKAIKDATIEYVNKNLKRQGYETIGEEPEEPETSEQPVAPAELEAVKEQAKNKLVEIIKQAIAQAESEGRDYTLADLITLEVPESTFTVSIDGDEATLNIDGFEFKVNSQFELYE